MLEGILYVKGKTLEKIGDLIPKGKVTLIHGRSGCGKTLSIIKYMENQNVEPYFIDFDSNDEYDDMKLTHIDGYKLIDKMKYDNSVIDAFKNQVVIVDTYAKAEQIMNSSNDIGDIHSFIDALIDRGNTVIAIAHTAYYSGKPAEPMVDAMFANHVACRLHLHNEVKQTKTSIYLEIEKLRGTDSKIIKNWMREPSILAQAKEM